MSNIKFLSILALTVFIFLSCSIANKLKEKFSSKKDETSTKETTKAGSEDEMKYYNEYIEVMNKIQDAGDGVNKAFMSDIPDAGSITKNSFIVPVSFSIQVGTLERRIKEFKRSFFDNGDLSKLTAPEDMKNEIESSFKSVLSDMEEYSVVSKKVSGYYSNYEYKKDISLAKNYDEEMKSAYEKYKSAFKSFSSTLKKYKPKRDNRDPNTISNPDERSSTIVVNAYGNILDASEGFYENFDDLNFKSDFSEARKQFNEFEKIFYDSRHAILNAEYTDRTKFMKYSFEDYFSKTAEEFIDEGKKFFDNEPSIKNDRDFRKNYNLVIDKYNYMITAYNTNIMSINMIRSWN